MGGTENNIDYMILLKRYMAHVGVEEGTTFIGDFYKRDDRFTEQEWGELIIISDEIDIDSLLDSDF